VWAAGAVVIAAFATAAAYDGWRLHQQIVAANNRELGNLSHALAIEAGRNLDLVDEILKDCASLVERGEGRRITPGTAAQLARLAQRSTQVENLSIADAHGKQIFHSGSGSEFDIDISDRPYFVALQNDPEAGRPDQPPHLSRTDGVEALFVSRRIDDRSGRFIGIVSATLSLDQLREQYTAIDLGAHSSLILALSDGLLVLRQPPVAATAKPMRFRELAEMGAGAPIQSVLSHVDSRPKLISAVAVGKSSLILAVLRDEADALLPWVDEMQSSAIRTVSLTLVTLLTIAGILHQLKRSERASEALRASESRYARVMAAANEGHAEWNLLDDAVFVSGKWRALHGIRDDAVVTTLGALKASTSIHPDDVPPLLLAWNEHLAGRSPAIDVDYRVAAAPDDWRWIHSRGSCLRSADGTPTSLFCSAVDVTDRKRAEAEKAGVESRLQQALKLEALGTLAGGIAHDFNNILGAILGFGEMVQRGAAPGTPPRRQIDRVLQAGERGRLLVKRILDLSRSRSSEHAPVGMRAVIDEVVGLLTPQLGEGTTLDLRLEAADATVIGDATQLCQVVLNVCTNAVQAIEASGRVEIAMHRRTLDAPMPLLQGDLGPGDYVCLDVTDTGPGIDPAILGRIFDPFFTTKRSREGTGLGLSVVHGIVSGMKGGIDVVAPPGGPTRVAIWLPVADEAALPPVSHGAEWRRGEGEVVMVVDDESSLVELAEELLATLGYEPVGFGSAEDAWSAFEEDPDRFDALLTDQALPGMDGDELARRMLERRPQLPVILMSGNLPEHLEREAPDRGIRAVLHKPLGLRQLAGELARLFGH